MSHDHHLGCACCSLPLLGQLAKTQQGLDDWRKQLEEFAANANGYFPPLPRKENIIFHGGVIRPLTAAGPSQVEALGIANGRIISTGSLQTVRTEMASHFPYREIDLGSNALLPGLIDPHLHILPSAIFQGWLQLGPFERPKKTTENKNPQESQYLTPRYRYDYIKEKIQDEIKAIKEKAPQGVQWLTGFGVDPSLMETWTNIDARMLDELAPLDSNIAIFLLNSSGHIGYANHLAMKEAKVPADIVDSSQGVFTEERIGMILKAIPQSIMLKDLVENLLPLLRQASERGITTVMDAGVGSSLKEVEVLLLETLANLDLSPVRICAALYSNELTQMSKWMSEFKPDLDSQNDSNFMIKALKLVADGSNQGLTGFQYQPYLDIKEHGVPNVPPVGLYNFKLPPTECCAGEGQPTDQLDTYLQLALGRGWPVLVHANGDHAMELVLNSYQQALDFTGVDAAALRPRVEHASLMTDASIHRMAKLGISPSFLIGHVGYWGYTFQKNVFGESRTEMLDRCKSALDAGMRISLHSDHFVSPLGPLRMAEQANYRKMEGAPGEDKPVLNSAECLNRLQALRAVTLDAAWQCHMDHLVGSLEVGKLADLVVLKQDPLDVNVENLRDIPVLETWRGGARVYRNTDTQ
ncbi:amidohydrolase family protein [Chromobacterium vaccinii]|uniref:amidohydrolase n=1 Tax=Chromobacterium vaccinii TaxID=1108595 RepID=UPI001E4DDBAC|nr:amidohydrolase [Chromobacterium vaccinii]MCD4486691.1 amidohydrolase family protein [Chromobacterium vaccinii]